MKRKGYVYSFIVLAIVVVSTVVLLFDRKVQIAAATTVFKEQQWHVQLSQAVKESSVEKGYVYVTRANGEKITAPITRSKDGFTLSVQGLKVGEYTLRITEDAFAKKGVLNKAQKISFKVIEKLETIRSEKELRDYFEAVIAKSYEAKPANNWLGNSDVAETESVANDSASSSGGNHSTTNNQVEGIEEGDITVTDGRHIFMIRHELVQVINVQQRDDAKVAGTIKLPSEAYPTQLMLHNGYLIVTAEQYIERQTANGKYDGSSFVKTFIYDVTNAASPTLVRELGQEGYFAGARKQGDYLYIVTNQTPNYYLLSEGEDVELVPAIYDSAKSGVVQSLPLENIHILPNSLEPSYVTISAFHLANMAAGDMVTESFLGSGHQMYMSEKAIYLAIAQYGNMRIAEASTSAMIDVAWAPTSSETLLYKFAIDQLTIQMQGQTTVPGQLLNQFAMDEYNGHLRIATTEYTQNREQSENHVYVYDGTLTKIGELTGLAKGERIYSVRFMGDKAYIVTFKEVDPLFVIDLANPQAPTVLGELKIPGFSNYLHPISETHLLGIGYDTVVKVDEYTKEPFVQTNGMKIALFDVSDLANPKEQDAVIIGGRGTYSEIQHQHKALFREPSNNLYGFPVVMYKQKGEYDVEFVGYGAQVYNVTVENGIQLAGDLMNYDVAGMEYEDWEKNVQRLLYVDDVVYTIGLGELRSYQLPSFTPIQQLSY